MPPRAGRPSHSVHVAAVDDDGEVSRCEAVLGEQRGGLRRAQLEKLVRLRRPGEEITQPVMLWLEADDRRPVSSDAPGSFRGQLEHQLVDVAPAPILARLDRAHDRMSVLSGVTACVLVGRRIAAPDRAARLTHPQVHPARADPQALLASGRSSPGGSTNRTWSRCEQAATRRIVRPHRIGCT